MTLIHTSIAFLQIFNVHITVIKHLVLMGGLMTHYLQNPILQKNTMKVLKMY